MSISFFPQDNQFWDTLQISSENINEKGQVINANYHKLIFGFFNHVF
jgi:hypothetical protein